MNRQVSVPGFQAGFTLIEALIAFLLLAVGMVGAAFFHSELIKESGNEKARSYAIKLAEERVEDLRNFVTRGEFLASIASPAVSGDISSAAVAGPNASFTVQHGIADVSSSAASASTSQLYRADVTVSWEGSEGDTQSIGVSSYIAWFNPLTGIDAEEAESGGAGVGVLEFPGGKGKAVTREATEVTAEDDGEVVFADGGVTAGVAVGGKAVELIQANDEHVLSADEIFIIAGRVAIAPEARATFPIALGLESDDDGVIDMLASQGANCVFYAVSTAVASGVTPEYDYGDYKCLMLEGWYGNVQVIKREADTNKTLEEDGNHFVCPKAGADAEGRAYKYKIVEVPDDFDDSVEASVADLSVVGQSGMVRFVSSGATGSEVNWDDYFWHNPNLQSPAESSMTPWGTMQAGDVPYQNFIVAKKGGGVNDCGDLTTDYSDSGVGFPDPATSEALPGDPVPDEASDIHNDNDTVILGYVARKFEISGWLNLSASFVAGSSAADPNYYGVLGSPNPDDFSIICTVDSTASSSTGSYIRYPYTCGIPVVWSGVIVARPETEDPGICASPDDPDAEDLAGWGTTITDGRSPATVLDIDTTDDVGFHAFENVKTDIPNKDFFFDPSPCP